MRREDYHDSGWPRCNETHVHVLLVVYFEFYLS